MMAASKIRQRVWSISRNFLFLALSGVVVMAACTAVPGRLLNGEEKQADLQWLYSQFGENYAPMAYKSQLFGFDYEVLKRQTDAAAAVATTNEEFYSVVHAFVSHFHDAHTGVGLTASRLPSRGSVAHLGFAATRVGDVVLVTDLLPGNTESSRYPLKKEDEILELDGVSVKVRAAELFKYRDLGNAEANLTLHMPRLFLRNSLENGLPDQPDAVLKVRRRGHVLDVRMPWVVRDLAGFTMKPAKEKDGDSRLPASWDQILAFDPGGSVAFALGLLDPNGTRVSPSVEASRIIRKPGFRFWDSFRVFLPALRWTVLPAETNEEPKAEKEKEPLKGVRELPELAVVLPSTTIFPTYLVNVADESKALPPRLVAYVLLDTFSPDFDDDEAVGEFNNTLLRLQSLGVRDIVIDTLNNGGGSLLLALRLAQALSPDSVTMPTLRVAINEGWLDDFQGKSLNGPSESEKELYRRVYVRLRADRTAGKRLSDPFSAESLQPYLLEPHRALKAKFNVLLLVNEMCASACDVFAGILQDNQLAKILGTATMGAGGNVVNHMESPNAHFELRQTESMIYRKDGSPIENRGIVPEIPFGVSEYFRTRYSEVRDRAFLEILGSPRGRLGTAVRFLPAKGLL
jgi:hypothetical protein